MSLEPFAPWIAFAIFVWYLRKDYKDDCTALRKDLNETNKMAIDLHGRLCALEEKVQDHIER